MVGHPGAVGRSLVLGAVAQAERLFVTVVKLEISHVASLVCSARSPAAVL